MATKKSKKGDKEDENGTLPISTISDFKVIKSTMEKEVYLIRFWGEKTLRLTYKQILAILKSMKWEKVLILTAFSKHYPKNIPNDEIESLRQTNGEIKSKSLK